MLGVPFLPQSHRVSLETSEAQPDGPPEAKSLSGAGSFSQMSQKQLLRNLLKRRVGFEDGVQHPGTPGGGRERTRGRRTPILSEARGGVQKSG